MATNGILNATPTIPGVPADKAAPTPGGVNTSPVAPNIATPAMAAPAQASLTTAQIDPNQGLVKGQLANIIDQNSPLMQRASARAMEAANSRGLANSSMAVGAGQAAVIDAATPIAQADAAATNQFALNNAQATNQNSQFNVTNLNESSKFNAAQLNDVAKTTEANKQQLAMQKLQMTQQTNGQIAQARSDHEAKIAAIMESPNMTAEAKNKAINELNASYKTFMDSFKTLDSIGITGLVDFGSLAKAAAPPTAIGAPAAVPAATLSTAAQQRSPLYIGNRLNKM